MKVHAPGKLILSGEHSVVYDQPALAMAVNRYAVATVTPQLLPLISFDLSDLAYEHGLTLLALKRLKTRIKQKYQRFIHGEFKIREVLHKPVELAQFALGLFLETLNFKLTQGIKIHVQSGIPMGCGMGSSAATVLSIVHAIAHHLRMDVPTESLYKLGLEAENMQHGYSSGLDLRVSMHGGCVLMQNGETHLRTVPVMPMYLVNTGTPLTTTGECVTYAAGYFKTSTIANDFAAVTIAMDQALQHQNKTEVMHAIRANHRLLTHIGVVPALVQEFVRDVENLEGSAKICGAGAVAGDKAGVVLVMTDDLASLATVCQRYHYSILPISGESRGVHFV